MRHQSSRASETDSVRRADHDNNNNNNSNEDSENENVLTAMNGEPINENGSSMVYAAKDLLLRADYAETRPDNTKMT